MLFGFLADAVVVLHVAFVLIVVFGGLVVWRWPWFAWLHLPATVWGVGIEWVGAICPLTLLEHWLRQQANEVAFEGTFVEQYILPWLYPENLTRPIQIGLGCFVLAVNVVAYSMLIQKRHRLRGTGLYNGEP